MIMETLVYTRFEKGAKRNKWQFHFRNMKLLISLMKLSISTIWYASPRIVQILMVNRIRNTICLVWIWWKWITITVFIDVIVHIYQDYICLLVETSRVDYIKANRAWAPNTYHNVGRMDCHNRLSSGRDIVVSSCRWASRTKLMYILHTIRLLSLWVLKQIRLSLL